MGRIAAALDNVQPVATWATTRSQRMVAIGEIHRLEARLEAVKLALVAWADLAKTTRPGRIRLNRRH